MPIIPNNQLCQRCESHRQKLWQSAYLGRSFDNGCGKEIDNQGSIIFNINFNIILTYRGGKFVLLL